MTDKSIPDRFDDLAFSIDTLHAHCATQTRPDTCPSAEKIESNVPIYSGESLTRSLAASRNQLKYEFGSVLRSGPGILVIRSMYEDRSVVDRCTGLFREIVEDERRAGRAKGDHFGNNERIWNASQKICLRDPGLFAEYFGNSILALISESWLGPNYQITAQMNNVLPGSPAQSVHRDYHLGFQTDETIAAFPPHAQIASQFLTLQGAVAHTRMPVASGPTRLLPYSHHVQAGYQTFRTPEVQAYFDDHHIQLPLEVGDAMFFSPAILHAAGENQTGEHRIANLLQISSAFGRTMESVDADAMLAAVYPILLEQQNDLTEREVRDTIAAAGDGYAFPTNLDRDPPTDGNAPATAQDLALKALKEKWAPDRLTQALAARRERQKA